MYNHEIIRLIGLADPETHLALTKSFDFYKKEAEDHPEFYEKQFGITREVTEFTIESTYYRGLLHSYMDKPAKITTSRSDPTFIKKNGTTLLDYIGWGWSSKNNSKRKSKKRKLVL